MNASCSFFLHEKLKKFIWLKWWFYTMWKTPNTEYFLVRIFLGLGWIRTFMSSAPYSVWMQKKNTDQKRLGIWTLHAVIVPLKCCLYWVFSSFCQRGKCHLFVLLSNILVIPSSHKQVHDQEEYRFIVYRSLQSLVSI